LGPYRAVSDVHNKMVSGATWMVALKGADNALGVISTIVLARLLVPSDFGALAMAMSVIALLELMSAFRFDVAIIQRQSVTREHLDTAWTFNVVFGAAVAAFTYGLAGAAAAFYNEPRLESILHVLAFGWLAFGLENIGTVAFRKELEFRKEFLFSLAKRVSMFAVTVPLAFILRNYWALVVGVVVGKFISVVISFLIHPFRPRFSLAGARDLFSFSTWLLLNNILYFVNDRVSNFIIGRVSGARALGSYNVAYEISCMPTVDLAAPINRAVFPGYAKLVGEGGTLHRAFVNTIGLMTLMAFPAGVGVAAVAGPLVYVALGSQWVDAVPLVAILGVYGAIAALGTNTAYVFIALGMPKMLTLLAGVRALILVPLLYFSSRAAGPVGAAWAIFWLEFAFRPATFFLALRALGAPASTLLPKIWRPIAASIPMYVCVQYAQTLLPAGEDFSHVAARLAVGVAVGVIVYVTIMLGLWRWFSEPDPAETLVIQRVRALIGRHSPA
jgi:O-antigen/teichoic acid export membrane protein